MKHEYDQCLCCDHWDISETNELNRGKCSKFSTFVNGFNSCDSFSGKKVDALFDEILEHIQIEQKKSWDKKMDAIRERMRNAKVIYVRPHDQQIREESIKEFVDRYKDHIKNYTGMFTDYGFYVSLDAVLSAVDFIKEEMIGDTE